VRKRPPAYAKDLIQARKLGLVPARSGYGHICVALGWRDKRSGGLPRLVVPDDLAVEEVDLTCLAGLDVLLTYSAAQASRAVEMVEALFAAHVASVTAMNMTVFDQCIEARDRGDQTLFSELWAKARVWHRRDAWR
jgi:hypothetical protein